MSEKDNDLFYLCSLLEYIGRKTNNRKNYIIDKIGKEDLIKLFNLSSVLHTENIDKVSDDIIKKHNIQMGNYIIKKNNMPSYFDIGKVYTNIIIHLSSKEEYIDNLINLMKSWLIEEIDNYNSSLYYENTSYLIECYKEGKIL